MISTPKAPKRNSSNSAAYLLAAALLSGIVSFRIGKFKGCTSSWIANIQETQSSTSHFGYVVKDDEDGDSDSPGYYKTSWEAATTTAATTDSSPQIPMTKSLSDGRYDPNDRRFVPRKSVPYDCGVVFFYHVPCTGGASINQWFRKYSKPELGNHSYYQSWALETRKNGKFHPDPESAERKFNEGMKKHIQNLGPNEWRIAHSHLVSSYLNESEDILHQWRSDVEAQGCELINTVMLRDPLNHAMSLHKIIMSKNSTRDVWTKYLSSPTGNGLWATVLDFFLYNNQGLRYHEDYPNGPGGRNPFNVAKEVKVKRALELLHRHFDIVTVGDHNKFQETLLDWTGWARTTIPRANVNTRGLSFSKKEVENLQKLLQKNGDTDFFDQAKIEYHDYLSYVP